MEDLSSINSNIVCCILVVAVVVVVVVGMEKEKQETMSPETR